MQTAATAKAALLQWRFLIKQDDPIDEDTFDVTLLASCPPELRVDSIVTAEDWGRLEPYLRESFEIPTSVKIGLQGKVLFSGKQALVFKVRDQPTLSTARFQIERLGQLLVDETEVTVEVEICAVDVGNGRPSPSRARASGGLHHQARRAERLHLRRDGLDAQLRDRLVEARLERHHDHAVGARVPGQAL